MFILNIKEMKQTYPVAKSFILMFMLASLLPIIAQETDVREFQRAFRNADMYYLYDENYLKAATLYEPLLKQNPDNFNLAAKLGICYLNLDGKKAEALDLLKKASSGVVSNEKEYKQTGVKAPLDTYLYLAIAFHRNDSLEQALGYLNDVKKRLSPSDTYQMDFIDLQIRNCRYAMEMKKRPLRIISEYFTPWLKEYPGACNPVLAKNDSVFIFTLKNEGITQVYCSYKDKTWSRPSNITKQLGGFDRFYTNSITGDGRLLLMYMDDGGDGNLYYSQRTDTTWSKIKSLGRNINSIYWEEHGFITPDGKTIYFSSNRPGGEGELDIWTSQRLADGSWDRPVNLGNTINTPYDETSPFYDIENNALLFSSIGHITMGGYDVFRSQSRGGGAWTQPVGMPYAFNNVQENTNFILNNNAPGFITSRFDDKSNIRNVFAIVAVDPADEITRASGTIKLEDGLEVNSRVSLITLKNLQTGEIIQNIQVNPDGSFNFDIKPGDYEVYISHDGYHTDTISLSLPLYYTGSYLEVNPSLSPEKVSAGDFLSIKNVLFDFDKYEITDEARQTLELLMNIIISYPDLIIEVAGYTDALGSTEYNRRLADKRAQAVIDYLTRTGIEENIFVKKAFGESNFVAVNTKPDGSDNPEGRKYNRRVTFGIVNPKTGVVLRQEAYTPRHLRQPSSMKYSIVLLQTKDVLSPGYFSKMIRDEMLFVRTVKTDSLNLYALGIFYNRSDAVTYLGYLKGIGLEDAYIINQYDLDNTSQEEDAQIQVYEPAVTRKVYTIQLKATRSPINTLKIFPDYEGVKEIISDDGFYKFVWGEFRSIAEAKEALTEVKKDFDDAFIREIDVPVNN
jgi:outer membrane protein OmpA-like peptidoglycan-associated protein/tetratricopeptide (TPR) repeat protein